MTERIAVETLSFPEISELFQQALEKAFPRTNRIIDKKLSELKAENKESERWIETFEDFKGAKLNFYCEKIAEHESPIVSIGMTHRTKTGMILITLDVSNGGLALNEFHKNTTWLKWVRIHTGHFCERFAERIMNASNPSFQQGSQGIMFSDMLGPVRVTGTNDGFEEIEFQFKEGQAYGYRDIKSKIVLLRTVYSNNMLRNDRLDFKNEWEQPLTELYEAFKH